MESDWTKKVIHEIGLNHRLNDKIVRAIVMSQFEIARDIMKNANPDEGYVPIIRLTELITFKVKPKKLKFLKGRKAYLKEQRERNLKLKR